ncbi:hypothetical protein J1N35_022738 [Gossypium stocksii]|uniref:Uncharacterized protein n=1 Tax=Gossypium stocksii TaxID=47602 RepID=A0A9D3VIH2_9ROSI|nr:hypothetical protein J1N35_022738 [Gossypium stocksii]
MHNQELIEDEVKTKSVHTESDDKKMDTTQTAARTSQSKAPMNDELTMSDTDDDEEEVSINQLKRKRFKKATGTTVQANSDDQDRPQRYKQTTRKST